MKKLRLFLLALCAAGSFAAAAIDHKGITSDHLAADRFTLIENGAPAAIVVADGENSAVRIAAANLAADFGRVGGTEAPVLAAPAGKRVIMAGTFDGPTLKALAKAGKIDVAELKGKREKYLISFVENPAPGVDEVRYTAFTSCPSSSACRRGTTGPTLPWYTATTLRYSAESIRPASRPWNIAVFSSTTRRPASARG